MSDAFSGLLEGLTEGFGRGAGFRRERDQTRIERERQKRRDEVAEILLASNLRRRAIEEAQSGYEMRPPTARPRLPLPSGQPTREPTPEPGGVGFRMQPFVPRRSMEARIGEDVGPFLRPGTGLEFDEGGPTYVGTPQEQRLQARAAAVGDLLARMSGETLTPEQREAAGRGEIPAEALFGTKRHERALELIKQRHRFPSRTGAAKPPIMLNEAIQRVQELYSASDEELSPQQIVAYARELVAGRPIPQPKSAPVSAADTTPKGPGFMDRVGNFFRGMVATPPRTTGAPTRGGGRVLTPGGAPPITMQPDIQEDIDAQAAQETRQVELDDLAAEMVDYAGTVDDATIRTILGDEGLSDEEIDYVLSLVRSGGS